MAHTNEESTVESRMQQIHDEMVAIHAIFAERAREIDSDKQYQKIVLIEAQSIKRLRIRFLLDASQGYPTTRPTYTFAQPTFQGYISKQMQDRMDELQWKLMEHVEQIPEGDVMVYSIMQIADEMVDSWGTFSSVTDHDNGDPTKEDDRTDVDSERLDSTTVKSQKAMDMKKLYVQLEIMERPMDEKRKEKRSQRKKKHQQEQELNTSTPSKRNSQPLSSKKKKQQEEDEIKQTTKPKRKSKWEHEIFERIKWDASIPQELVVIGYLDRFEGIKEIPFVDFKGVHEDLEGVPMHRIRYFKLNGTIVWDRDNRIDLLTGGSVSHLLQSQQNAPQTMEVTPSSQVTTLGTENPITFSSQISASGITFPRKQSISIYRYFQDWKPLLSGARTPTDRKSVV